jgi:ABC-type antimicrobial peptide transport system permease subunit
MSRLPIYGYYHFSTDFSTENRAEMIPEIDAGVRDVLGYSSYSVQKYFGSAVLEYEQSVTVYGADENTLDFEQARLISGRFPSELNEAATEERLLQSLGGIAVGDSFELEFMLYGGEVITQQFTLSGIIRSLPNRARYHDEYGVIYTTNETVATAYGEKSPPGRFLLRMEDENYRNWVFGWDFDHMKAFENIVSEVAGITWYGNWGHIGTYIRNTGRVAYVIPAVFIISVIVIFGIFNVSLASREKQYALLRYLGMSRHMIFYMSVFEALLMGIAGWFFGVIIGFGLHLSVLRRVLGIYLDLPITGTPYMPSVLYALAVCVGISIFSCAVPAFKFLKTNIEQKIKNPKKVFKKKDFQNPRFFLLNIFVREKKNIIISISLIISMVLGIFTSFTSAQFRIWMEDSVHDFAFDVYIGNLTTQRRLFASESSDEYPAVEYFHAGMASEIMAIDGVTDAWGVYFYTVFANLEFGRIFTHDPTDRDRFFLDSSRYELVKNGHNGILNPYVAIFAGDEHMFREALRDGIITTEQYYSLINPNGETNVIARTELFLQGIPEGEYRQISLSGSIESYYDGEIRLFNIIADTPHYIYTIGSPIVGSRRNPGSYAPGGLTFFVLNDNFFQSEEEKRYHSIRVYIDSGADRFAVKQQLHRLLLPYQNGFIFDVEEEYHHQYSFALSILIALVILVVMIYLAMLFNVFNVIMTAIEERRRIYASLRVIGMDYNNMRKMILSEIISLSLVASVIGFVIGIGVTIALSWNLVEMSSLPAVLQEHPWGVYVVVILGNILFASLVASLCINTNKFKEKIELL